MTRLVRQHALVTGGGTGIGAAIARALAAEGAVLTLVGRRREPLDAMAAELPGAAIATANVGDMAQVEAAFAAATARHGPVSVLVNNAGLAASGPFARVSPEEWRAAMATRSSFRVSGALPDMPTSFAWPITFMPSMFSTPTVVARG